MTSSMYNMADYWESGVVGRVKLSDDEDLFPHGFMSKVRSIDKDVEMETVTFCLVRD